MDAESIRQAFTALALLFQCDDCHRSHGAVCDWHALFVSAETEKATRGKA